MKNSNEELSGSIVVEALAPDSVGRMQRQDATKPRKRQRSHERIDCLKSRCEWGEMLAREQRTLEVIQSFTSSSCFSLHLLLLWRVVLLPLNP